MKFTKFLMGLIILAVGAITIAATDNVFAGLVAMPLTQVVFQAFTGISLFDSKGLAMATLATIPRTAQQTVNPGGGRRLFLCPTDNFVGEWPSRANITAGEVTVVPTMTTTPTVGIFVEVAISDNSLKLDEALKGATGYQSWEQGLELKVAGYSKEQCAAIEKLLNVDVVAVVILTDGLRVVLGTSLMGLQFEITHTTGAKGGDRREWTLKAKNDGYQFGYVPLGVALALAGVTLV